MSVSTEAIKAKSFFTFSQFLSATIGPPVALVSAPRQIPSGSPVLPPPNFRPTMVVPVDVAVAECQPTIRLSERLNGRQHSMQ